MIGGTGMVGQPVSNGLNEAGLRVRVMTRDRQKACKLFDDSFEIVATNLPLVDALSSLADLSADGDWCQLPSPYPEGW